MGAKNNMNAILELSGIHKEFEKEVSEFIKRNIIAGNPTMHVRGEAFPQILYCQRCFKAHILKKAEEFKLGEKLITVLKLCLKGDEGHDGYYLDAQKVKRCRK